MQDYAAVDTNYNNSKFSATAPSPTQPLLNLLCDRMSKTIAALNECINQLNDAGFRVDADMSTKPIAETTGNIKDNLEELSFEMQSRAARLLNIIGKIV